MMPSWNYLPIEKHGRKRATTLLLLLLLLLYLPQQLPPHNPTNVPQLQMQKKMTTTLKLSMKSHLPKVWLSFFF